jgi:hypothetical protein
MGLLATFDRLCFGINSSVCILVAEDGQSSVRFHACPPTRSASATASRSASGPVTRAG